jgi:ABC-2 type transport system permease protein
VGFFLGARFAGSTEDINGPVAAIGVPLLVLGGTFFPTDLLPPFLYVLAQADPIFHMNTALKVVAGGEGGLREVAVNVGALVAFAAAAIVLGARSYHKMLRQEQFGS